MLGDKNEDVREGDSYKAIYFVLPDLVTVLCDKKTRQFPILTGRWFYFLGIEVSGFKVFSAVLCH